MMRCCNHPLIIQRVFNRLTLSKTATAVSLINQFQSNNNAALKSPYRLFNTSNSNNITNSINNKSTNSNNTIDHSNNNIANSANQSFSDIGITEPILLSALNRLSIISPSKIQLLAIPQLIQSNSSSGNTTTTLTHSIIAAETGVGKTLAYLLPILQSIIQLKQQSAYNSNTSPRAIILVPNRELIAQIQNVLFNLLGESGSIINYKSIHGTQLLSNNNSTTNSNNTSSNSNNTSNNSTQLDLLITTPSCCLLNLESLELHQTLSQTSKLIPLLYSNLLTIVFDEADLLLNSNSIDCQKLLAAIKRKNKHNNNNNNINNNNNNSIDKSTVIFVAATLPNTANYSLINRLLRPNKLLLIQSNKLHTQDINKNIKQLWIELNTESERINKLESIINTVINNNNTTNSNSNNPIRLLVFCNLVDQTERLYQYLSNKLKSAAAGIQLGVLHKHVKPADRLLAIDAFNNTNSNNNIRLLISTNLSARGFDFNPIDYIIQFDMATSVQEHLHRVGRANRLNPANNKNNTNIVNIINFYSNQPQQQILVDVIRSGLTAENINIGNESNENTDTAVNNTTDRSNSLSHAFSRKRSFKRRFRPRQSQSQTQKHQQEEQEQDNNYNESEADLDLDAESTDINQHSDQIKH